MNPRALFRSGLVGAIVAAICCATPVLSVVLGLLGLAAWLRWLDYVLVPALLVCLAITGYAWARLHRGRAGPGGPETASRRATK